jgi:tRNA (uracil-5-)-methyltransferase TRM9
MSIIDTYNSIALEFSRTRHYMWKGVKEFLDTLNSNTSLADIGCGNGKNMMYRKDLCTTGIDLCDGFLNICSLKGLNVIKGCITDIPMDSNSMDNVISVAVIHHLDTLSLRLKAISELLRIVKPGGSVLISVWSFEQDKMSKRQFLTQDEMVPFKLQNGSEFHRYYHLYKKLELETELKMSIENFNITASFEEKNNYFVIFKKT